MKSILEKLLLIIGIALVIAAIGGYVMREKRYFILVPNERGYSIRQELSYYDYYQYNRSNPDVIIKTSFSLQWGTFLFILTTGLGVIVSFLRMPVKAQKLYERLKKRGKKKNELKLQKVIANDDINHNKKQPSEPIKNQLDNYQEMKVTNHDSEGNIGIIMLDDPKHVLSQTTRKKNKNAIFTFLVVLFSSASYAAVRLIFNNPPKSRSNENEVVGELFFFLLLPFILYALGGLLALIPFLLKKNYKSTFYTATITISLVICISAAIGTIENYYANKNEVISIQSQEAAILKEQTKIGQLYENRYYSIKYPDGWKVESTSYAGYLNQVAFCNSEKLNIDYIKVNVGVVKNTYGPNLNLNEFARKIRSNMENLLPAPSTTKDTLVHDLLIGTNKACGFKTTYKEGNFNILCRTYILKNNNYIAFIIFSSTLIECEPSFYRDIVGSMQLK